MAEKSKIQYATWRTDKEKEPGFSHELISIDSKNILNQTDLDTLEAVPFEGVDTIVKAIERNLQKSPNENWLGTRKEKAYVWTSYKDAVEKAKTISLGFKALELIPDIEGENGNTWKFMGIQAKNREEWAMVHVANMYQGATTIAFYDTLGPDATKYIINQTKVTTMSVSNNYVKVLSNLKKADAEADNNMESLANLVSFEDVSDEDKKLAEEAGLKVYTLAEVIAEGEKGKEGAKYNEP